MELRIIAIGKIKDHPLSEMIDKYLKKINYWIKTHIIELPEVTFSNENSEYINKALWEEGQHLLNYFHDSYNIVLAIEGKTYDSLALSKIIDKLLTNSSYKYINFIIGSSHGIHPVVKEQAQALISFSALTFPHQLMRLLVCEQVYRALTIIKNTKYHK